MEFRPCIDIHNGKVKQIVGSSLKDKGDMASENFISDKGGAYYASLYKEHDIKGGHIILLNGKDSEYYEATRACALEALKEFPGGLQIGGGITAENAYFYIEKGASHVIVTSYVFKDGQILYDNLDKLIHEVGKEHVVLDISCKKTNEGYKIATNRWQNLTDIVVSSQLLSDMSVYCDEYLLHAVDVEGKRNGIEETLVELLGKYDGLACTYAGGISSIDDLEKIKILGNKKVNATIGSALDIFGGNIAFSDVVKFIASSRC